MKYLVQIIIALTLTNLVNAQCVVNSTDGYTVEIFVKPVSLVAPSNCLYGYNYNVNIQYDIVYKGTPPPSGLYTLQGTLGCGSDNLFYDLPNGNGSGIATTTSNPYNNNSDCNSATVQSLGCFNSVIEIEAPGISRRFINCGAAALPITLNYFEAKDFSDRYVKLNWQTETELNNDFFTLERSIDGVNWKSFKVVKGAGNSNSPINYSHVDDDPNGKLLYYRLKQTDFDGEFSYSSIVVIELPDNTQISLYPNPSETTITISGENIDSYLIFDLLGRNLTTATNVIDKSNSKLVIDISNLNKGNYLLFSKNSKAKFTKI
jgi:hypothetical protein